MSDPQRALAQQMVREGVEAYERRRREECRAAIARCRERLLRDGPDPGVYKTLSQQLVRLEEQEEALAILEPGAFFGEMALIDFLPRAADALANAETDVFFIPLPALRDLLEQHPQLAMKVLFALCEVLTQRLRETNERFMSVFTIAQWGAGVTNDLIPLP